MSFFTKNRDNNTTSNVISVPININLKQIFHQHLTRHLHLPSLESPVRKLAIGFRMSPSLSELFCLRKHMSFIYDVTLLS